MTKFEQLLDYIVNEEHDKANELFHEIVVEKSREIYENLIAQEAADEEMDEAADEEMDEAADEEMDESADEEMDESADEEMDEAADEDMDEAADEEMDEADEELEDSYMMDGDDDMGMDEPGGLEKTDDLTGDVGMDTPEDDIKMSIQKAMSELQAAFDAAEDLTGGTGDEFSSDDDEDDEMPKEDDMMGFMEGRRMTREYVEKVGNDWDKSGTQKGQNQHVAAGTGDKASAPNNGKSPISSGSGKPTSSATGKNLVQSQSNPAPDGTKPHGKAGGFLSQQKDMNTGNGNVPGGKMGVKNLKQVAQYGKGEQTNPTGLNVGARTGQNDNQGETNTKSVVDRKM